MTGTKTHTKFLISGWKHGTIHNYEFFISVVNFYQCNTKVVVSRKVIDHAFPCFLSQAWKGENDRVQEKLLTLIGKIGKDTRDLKTTNKVSNGV